jgi:hypothetical protein
MEMLDLLSLVCRRHVDLAFFPTLMIAMNLTKFAKEGTVARNQQKV